MHCRVWLQERASAHCARLIELSPPPHDHPKMRQTYMQLGRNLMLLGTQPLRPYSEWPSCPDLPVQSGLCVL